MYAVGVILQLLLRIGRDAVVPEWYTLVMQAFLRTRDQLPTWHARMPV